LRRKANIDDETFVHVTTNEAGENINKFGFDPSYNPDEAGGFVTKLKYVKNVDNPNEFVNMIYKKSLQLGNVNKFEKGATLLKIDFEKAGTRDLLKYYNRTNAEGIPQWLYPEGSEVIPPNFIDIIKKVK
jgi:hypothetical protein